MSLIMLPFYTRWLSVEDYGVTDIINVYVTLLLGLATACIADAVFIFPKGEPIEKQKKYFSSGLFFAFLSLLSTALLFKIVIRIFAYNGPSNSFTDNAWFVYGLLVVTFLQQYTQQFVRSIDKMKIYSTAGIILTVCTALFSFIMIPRWGVFGYVYSLIFANIFTVLYSLFFSGAFKYFAFRKIEKAAYVEMLKYSIPLVPNAVMWWLVGAFNRPLMEHYLGMHAIGIYGVASRFSGILNIFFSIFGMSWQISVMEEFVKEGYSYFFNKMFRLIVVGLVFLFLLLTAGSKMIVRILASPDFFEAWKYIPILTLGAVLSSVSGLVGSNFAAAKESKYFFYSAIWAIASSLICNFLLIPRFGIMGAAIAAPITYTVIAASRILYCRKYVRIKNIKPYAVMSIIGILMIFNVLYIHTMGLKVLIMLLLFSLFIITNYKLKEDVVKGIYLLKSMFKNP